jgi:hypothetical protein
MSRCQARITRGMTTVCAVVAASTTYNYLLYERCAQLAEHRDRHRAAWWPVPRVRP